MKNLKLTFKFDTNKVSQTDLKNLNVTSITIPCKFWCKCSDKVHLIRENVANTVNGTAYCNLNTDEFSKETGILIAKTKAETKAYKIAKKHFEKRREELLEELNAIDEFILKADNCIDHNNKFLEDRFINNF